MAQLSELGRYELRGILGKGAKGVVYAGFDPSLNGAVAIKTILKSIATDQETTSGVETIASRRLKCLV